MKLENNLEESDMDSNYISLKELVSSANTGADAIKRAPIVEENTGLRCIRIGDISNNRPFNEWGFTRAEDTVISKFLLKKDDILVARTGNTIGVVKYIDKDLKSLFNNGLIRLKVNSNSYPKYIYYNLISNKFKQYIHGISAGTSTQPNMKINHMLDYKVMDIPYNEQKEIADILSSLDEKIELNNQMNETLEEMAQALFKRWFVDFEFPNEEGHPYKSSGGEMVESELGIIPRYWTSVKITEVANVFYGAAFKSKLFNEDGIGLPLIRIRDLKTFEPQFYTNEQHAKAKIVNPGSIVVGMDAEFTPTIWKGEIGYLNQRVCMFISNKNYIHDYFIFSAIKPHMKFLEFSKVGTTVIHLSKSDIDNIKIILPDKILLEQYKNVMQPIFDEMVRISMENKDLKKIRDALLPKLMSGEIRVSDLKS